MLKIKIDENHIPEVQETLDVEQKRASARTFTATEIVSIAKEFESSLEKQNIPKKLRKGISVTKVKVINVAAYAKKSYSAESTQIILTRGSDAWFLMGCSRVSINPRHEKSTHVTTPEETKKYIYETSVSKFEASL